MIRPSLAARALCAAAALLASPAFAQDVPDTFVQYVPCPNDGVQPRVERDRDGLLHLLYFKGDPEGGDLFWVTSSDDAATFSDPIRVNDVEGSVDGSTVRQGGRLTTEKKGRPHVAWIGARVEGEDEQAQRRAMYARLDDEGKAFEPARALSGDTGHLDVAPTLIYSGPRLLVFWHAPGETEAVSSDREPSRRLYVVASDDDGVTFTEPRAADSGRWGVSAGCTISAGQQRDGTTMVLYRSRDDRQRDSRILLTEDRGETFTSVYVENWKKARTPETCGVLRRGPKKLYAAWETDDEVYWAPLRGNRTSVPQRPRRSDAVWRGRPDLAVTESGAVCILWVEGGSPDAPVRYGWQVFDNFSRGGMGVGTGPDATPGALPAAFVRADDSGIVVVY